MVKHNLQVGDKVRCINDSLGELESGEIYTIIELDLCDPEQPYKVATIVNGEPYYSWPYSYELDYVSRIRRH